MLYVSFRLHQQFLYLMPYILINNCFLFDAAMLVTRKISLVRAIFYTVAQLGGALLGSYVLMILTPPSLRGTLGATLVSKEITVGQAFGIEFMVTFILLLAVCASMDTKRTDLQGSTPILIGLTVAGCHLFGVGYFSIHYFSIH